MNLQNKAWLMKTWRLEEPPQRPTAKITIVDHPANLKALGDILRKDGYAVQSFSRGGQRLRQSAKTPRA